MDFEAYMRLQRARLRAFEEETLKPSTSHAVVIKEKGVEKQTPTVQPVGIDAVNERRLAAFSKANRLHSQLRWFPSNEERYKACRQILELEREFQECWRIIDHHKKTGELLPFKQAPEPKDFDPAEYRDAELLRMRSNAQKYISNAPKRGYSPEKVAQRKELIETIDNYLNEPI